MTAIMRSWIVYSAVILAFVLVTALVARAKGRDPLTFGLLGLLLGWIGLVVAILVPGIRLENLDSSYRDTSGPKPRLVRGKLVPYFDRLVFTSAGKDVQFAILASDILSCRIITRRGRKRAALPGKMFGIANLRVLEIFFSVEGQAERACFSIYKTAAEPLQQQIAEMGNPPAPLLQTPGEAQMPAGGWPYRPAPILAKPSMTGVDVLLLILVLLMVVTPLILDSLSHSYQPETTQTARTSAQTSVPEAEELNPTSVEAVLSPVQVYVLGDEVSSNINWTCYDIAPLDDSTTWACGTNAVVARIDGEGRWVARLGSDFTDFVEISAPDKDNIWVLDSKGRIACSHDSGQTFNKLEFQNKNVAGWAFQGLRAIDAACLWLMTDGDHVLRTTDAGMHWECHELLDMQYGVRDAGPISCLTPVDSLTCWAAKSLEQLSEKRPIDLEHNCFVYKTTDGGQTWQLTSSRGFPNVGLIEARGPQEAFILAGTAAPDWSWRSTSGEESNDQAQDLPNIENVLLVTSDGGKTWSEPLLRNASSVDLADDNTLWAVLPGEPQSQVLVGTNAGSEWASHPVDIPLARLTLDDSMWIGPGVVSLSESSAWVLGSGSFWWGLASTTDAGESWTYYDQQEP